MDLLVDGRINANKHFCESLRVFDKPTPRDVSLGSNMHGPLELWWASLSENIWHLPVSGNEDWVVLTFHTASVVELIDEYKD